jgi:hypothetical protein
MTYLDELLDVLKKTPEPVGQGDRILQTEGEAFGL